MAKKHHSFLLFFYLFLSSSLLSLGCNPQIPEDPSYQETQYDHEEQALRSIYHQNGGDSWNPGNWLHGEKCSWQFVTCNSSEHIVKLYLTGGMLQGTLSTEIGNLIYLEELSIVDTSLHSLPEEIGFLQNLKSLTLFRNSFSKLPNEIGK